MIGRLTVEQFAACYEALSMGVDFITIAKMVFMDTAEFISFVYEPAIKNGFAAFE